MHPGFLALISGGLIYIASAAVGAMQASGEVSALAWLGIAAVAVCHAAQGFFVIGDRAAVSQSIRTIFLRAGASALMTELVLAAAVIAVSFFPLPLARTTALSLVVVSVLASALVLTVTAGRSWRSLGR
jgi:hypothetical protein